MTRVTEWTFEDGKLIFRLVRYIWHSVGDRLILFIGNTEFNFSLHWFFDADFAADVVSQMLIFRAHLVIQTGDVASVVVNLRQSHLTCQPRCFMKTFRPPYWLPWRARTRH